MPWSVGFDVGPLRYSHRIRRRRSGPPAPMMALLGFAAVGVIVAGLVLFAVAVVVAWLAGFMVGLVKGESGLRAARCAMAVVNWGRKVVQW